MKTTQQDIQIATMVIKNINDYYQCYRGAISRENLSDSTKRSIRQFYGEMILRALDVFEGATGEGFREYERREINKVLSIEAKINSPGKARSAIQLKKEATA